VCVNHDVAQSLKTSTGDMTRGPTELEVDRTNLSKNNHGVKTEISRESRYLTGEQQGQGGTNERMSKNYGDQKKKSDGNDKANAMQRKRNEGVL